MSLNPGGTNYNWNYSNQQREGYSETLVGTVLAIQQVQSRAYNPGASGPGAAEFWPDGNPKMNIRISLADQNGQLKTFTFQPAGKDAREGRKPSVHMTLFHLTGDTDMMNLIGKTIQLQTWPQNPQTGQAWQRGNPRQFAVSEVQAGPYALISPAQLPWEFSVPQLTCNEAASGGKVTPSGTAPQNIQQPAYSAQPVYTAPVDPVTMVGAGQVPVVPIGSAVGMTTPTIPVGMDPNVAAAMQSVGATNIQPVVDAPQPYQEDIPF